MHWLIENLDLLFGVGEILSGVKRIVLASAAAVSLQACTMVHKESQDAIGATTSSWGVYWGEAPALPEPKPARYATAPRIPRRIARRDYYAPASPLAPKEYQGS